MLDFFLCNSGNFGLGDLIEPESLKVTNSIISLSKVKV